MADLDAISKRHEQEYEALLAQQEEQLQRARDREPEVLEGAASRFEAREQYRKRQAFIARLEQQKRNRKESQ